MAVSFPSLNVLSLLTAFHGEKEKARVRKRGGSHFLLQLLGVWERERDCFLLVSVDVAAEASQQLTVLDTWNPGDTFALRSPPDHLSMSNGLLFSRVRLFPEKWRRTRRSFCVAGGGTGVQELPLLPTSSVGCWGRKGRFNKDGGKHWRERGESNIWCVNGSN